jgi:hypothetical protein
VHLEKPLALSRLSELTQVFLAMMLGTCKLACFHDSNLTYGPASEFVHVKELRPDSQDKEGLSLASSVSPNHGAECGEREANRCY